jgi:hypothetical protein
VAAAPDPHAKAGAPPLSDEDVPEDVVTDERRAAEAMARPAKRPGTPEGQWRCIIEKLTEKQPSLAACLSECRLHSMDSGRISIELPPNQFHTNWIKREKSRALLKEICCEQLGQDAEICLLDKDPERKAATENGKENTERLRQEALDHPMVSAAMKLFHGRIVDVKIL